MLQYTLVFTRWSDHHFCVSSMIFVWAASLAWGIPLKVHALILACGTAIYDHISPLATSCFPLERDWRIKPLFTSNGPSLSTGVHVYFTDVSMWWLPREITPSRYAWFSVRLLIVGVGMNGLCIWIPSRLGVWGSCIPSSETDSLVNSNATYCD